MLQIGKKEKETTFFSFGAFDGIKQSAKHYDDGRDFRWRPLRWIRVEKASPFQMKCKETLSGDFNFYIVNWKSTKVGKPRSTMQLKPLYDHPINIKHSKYKDLMTLLDFIPTVYHDFDKELPHDGLPP
ncbi:unnamed protein product [Psylliodes chrysocephalus]|uniref:Uncharacterized protein n=1 Tax=Psylliodes chrysocephalus TaxID=3402493 RepID=A0A9P0CWW0_9CUCU|nr:unnamed protein product [Psylliodes chrysocephala]